MKNFFIPILSVFTVFTLSLAVTSTAFAQETIKQATEDKVEVKKPSLTYYYIDQ